CARWHEHEAARLVIAELADRALDWGRFVALAKHHRIVPLVSRNAQAVLRDKGSAQTQAALAELKRYSGAGVMRSLRMLSELRRVVEALRAAGVPVRVIKGFP